MIDTHAHIDAPEFENDLDEVIVRTFESGLEAVIIPATEPARFQRIFDICCNNDKIFCSLGIHPHNADEINSQILNEIYDYSKSNNKIVGIGEIGLDYFYDFAPKNVQQKGFREQLEIAKSLNKPVIVHNRESTDDLIKIIEEAQDGSLRGVLHCFYGDLNFLKKAIDLNFNVSFTGNITFKKFDQQEVIKEVPVDRFMIETDSPYMTPVPFRGKRNEPSFVKYVAEKISEIKKIEIGEIINMTTQNAKKFFGLFALIFVFALFANSAIAQDNNDDIYYEEEAENAYKKNIGLGFLVGTNTIVESFTPRPQTVSYEGMIAYGGLIQYSPIEYVIVGASYVYSKNTKIHEIYEFIEPNTHQVLELTGNFIVNPHSRINLYAMLGPNLHMNSYGKPEGGIDTKTQIGINTGMGFIINIPISDAGILALSAEWKLNFLLGTLNLDYDTRKPPTEQKNNPVEINTFFSIPRLNVVFFPNLF